MLRVLIANRGEIAIRIMRACRELGFTSIAVYSEADRDALHTRYADEAYLIGPAEAKESYLNIDKIIAVAIEKRVDAIHPGYGFLSENEIFAQKVEDAGMIFIGPRPETIALTGDKLAARRIAREVGLKVLLGPDAPLNGNLENIDVTYPVMVKAISGGGGKGIRDIKTTARNGEVVSVVAVCDSDQVLMMTARGKLQRVNVAEIKTIGRNTQGVRIMRLDEADTLAAVVPVPPSEQEEADAVAEDE